MNIFPRLKLGKWVKLNLNDLSKDTTLDLINPNICQRWIETITKKRKADFSFGGFLEDRTYIWRNHPNEKGQSLIHLGVDYNVPANTALALPQKAQLIHILKDPDNSLGWGGRLIFKLENSTYLLFGHLKQNILLSLGQLCDKDEIIGLVGDSTENGNWFPHLHVQLMDQTFLDFYKDDLNKIDGYLPNGHPNLNHIKNPEQLIF